MKPVTVDDMNALAIRDKNAARLMAFFIASDRGIEIDGESRLILLKAALLFSDAEFERCLEVLEKEGFGKVVWMN